jgi:hypothetical protein
MVGDEGEREEASQRTHLRRHREVYVPPPLLFSRPMQNARRADFHMIRRCRARKLERSRAALPKSTWNFSRFPNANFVAIQIGELDLKDSQFQIPCSNYDIQTEPKTFLCVWFFFYIIIPLYLLFT